MYSTRPVNHQRWLMPSMKRKANGDQEGLKPKIPRTDHETYQILMDDYPPCAYTHLAEAPRTPHDISDLPGLRQHDGGGGETDQETDSDSSLPSLTDGSGSANTNYSGSNSRSASPHSKELILYGFEERSLIGNMFPYQAHTAPNPNTQFMGEIEMSSIYTGRKAVTYRQENDSQSGFSSHESVPSSVTSQQESRPAVSSIQDHQHDSATNHGSSSQSQTSSRVSDAATDSSSAKPDNPETVEGVIFEELRDDPEVAALLFQKLKGVLEYAPVTPVAPLASDGKSLEQTDLLTMFNLHTIDDSEPMYHHGVWTCAPSSSSGTSSSKNIPERSKDSSSSSASSCSNAFGLSNDTTPNKNVPEDGKTGPSTTQDKKSSISGAPTRDGFHGLKCFHNAARPDTFCTNHHTGNDFRSCAGSGWLTFQHLKEHIGGKHKAERSSPFICSNCQKDYKNEKSLKGHNKSEDCDIKCPLCDEKFEKKAFRTSHQEKIHPNGDDSVTYNQLSDSMWKALTSALKKYTDALKKGEASLDPELRKWVANNTPRYNKNRKEPKAWIDLGQWYIAFHVLNLQEKIPDHPFYDFYQPAELAITKIRVIYRNHLMADIEKKGFPAQDPEHPDLWVRYLTNILDGTLRMARKLQISSDGRSQLAEDNSMDESAPATAIHRPQRTVPTCNEVGALLPSATMLTHQQQQTMEQFPNLDARQNFSAESQAAASIANMTTDMTTDMTGMFGQEIYTRHHMGPLPSSYLFDQSQDNGGFFNDQYMIDQPDSSENAGNWLPRDHQQ